MGGNTISDNEIQHVTLDWILDLKEDSSGNLVKFVPPLSKLSPIALKVQFLTTSTRSSGSWPSLQLGLTLHLSPSLSCVLNTVGCTQFPQQASYFLPKSICSSFAQKALCSDLPWLFPLLSSGLDPTATSSVRPALTTQHQAVSSPPATFYANMTLKNVWALVICNKMILFTHLFNG